MKKKIAFLVSLLLLVTMFSGGLSAYTGNVPYVDSFSAYKTDGDGKPLPGATLRLDGINDAGVQRVYNAVTDANGLAQFTEVEYGDYILKEHMPPQGYFISGEQYTIKVTGWGVYITEDGVFYPDYPIDYEPVTFVNEVIEYPKVEITAYKVDGDGNPLAGATIRLNGANEAGLPRVYNAISDEDGEVVFEGVEYGEYVMTEHSAPAGYKGSSDSYRIRINQGGIFDITDEPTGSNRLNPYEPVTFVNEKIVTASPSPTAAQPTATPQPNATASLTALKTDGDGKPLAGATLRLEGANTAGNLLAYTAVSGSNGVAAFNNVENGDYTLSEHIAPPGYNATDATYKIKITQGSVADVTNPNAVKAYQQVTFVNMLIPTLNRDDHFAYMQGYPEGTFGPSRNMTRAEAVVMFSRLLNESMDLDVDYRNDAYPDVPAAEWYANQVGYMQRLGVLANYSRDGLFRPDEEVTRAEFATLAAHFDNLALTDENRFTDVPDSHWAVKYINSSAEKGWIIGYGDNTFRPEAYIIRAEVVTLVNRILERSADEEYLAANAATLPRSYSDVAGHWAYLMIMEASIGHDFVKTGAAESWTAVYE